MTEQAGFNPKWVVTSERSINGPLHSLKAGWTTVGRGKAVSAYERPPFPILIEKPSLYDMLSSVRFSDFFMFGTIYGAGILAGFALSRPFPLMTLRMLVYHGTSHAFFCTAAAATTIVVFRRLTGYWDNGLRWRKPEDRMTKFDTTSHFEKATGWSRFKINPNDQ